MDDLRAMAPPDATACLELLGRYDYGRPEAIADPYFVSVFLEKVLNIVDLYFKK